jgi:hypothetical protein
VQVATWQGAAAGRLVLVVAAILGAAPGLAAEPGSSVDNAIVLPGIQHETDGVSAEYAYIREHFPGCKPGTQALLSATGRQYDSIELSGPSCAHAVFFDITDWFGK